MLRAAVVLCLLVTSPAAAPLHSRKPSSDLALALAEKAWAAAVTEQDPARQVAAWDAAAAAFMRVVDDGAVGEPVQKEAASAALLAWRNALAVDPRVRRDAPTDTDFGKVSSPQPLGARDQLVVRTVAVYLRFAPPPGDAAAAKFLRANLLRQRDHHDQAIADYLDILEHHRDQDVAQYAANLLLDTYNRQQRFVELIALANTLRADPRFLANKPDLAATVHHIHRIAVRRDSEAIERRAKMSGDLAEYDRCGESYLAMLGEPGLSPREAEELRYNAGVCFHAAGSIDRAIATFRELLRRHPRSPLAGRALARAANVLGSAARFAEAAELLEQYSVRFAGEKDALDAASDGVRYAVATGDLVRAARIADRVLATRDRRWATIAVEATLAVLDAQLAAGQRRAAATRARRALTTSALHRRHEPPLALRAAYALAAAACPVALVDELCPRPRDRALGTAVRRLLRDAGARAAARSGADDASAGERATRLALDLELEPILATRAPATDPTTVAAVAAGYERLVGDARGADIRIAAHARLGMLHRHLGDRGRAVRALRACVAAARATLQGSAWLGRCERDLAAAGAPDPEILPERVPRPTAPPILMIAAPP